jgi:hypothetical protein
MNTAETSTQPRPTFQMRIEPELLEKIRTRARRERRSMSEWIRYAAVLELRRKRAA